MFPRSRDTFGNSPPVRSSIRKKEHTCAEICYGEYVFIYHTNVTTRMELTRCGGIYYDMVRSREDYRRLRYLNWNNIDLDNVLAAKTTLG